VPIKGRRRIVAVVHDLPDRDPVHALALGQFPKRLGEDLFKPPLIISPKNIKDMV
jgi:hypothetical protein